MYLNDDLTRKRSRMLNLAKKHDCVERVVTTADGKIRCNTKRQPVQQGVQEVVTVPDFNLHEPSTNYHFLYHGEYHLLLTIHGDSCYAAHMDGNLQDSLLESFRYKLEDQVKSVIERKDDSRMVAVTGEDLRVTFGDPLADRYCADRDIFFITPDYLMCDFDKFPTPCAWIPDQTRSLQWQVHQGPTPSKYTGPEVDNTLKTDQGQFMYMEANEGSVGEVAEIRSPPVKVDKKQGLCLRFYYNMFGTDVETLEVLVQQTQHTATPSSPQILWAMSKNQGIGWKLAEVTVPPSPSWASSNAQLFFRALRGSSHFGDIAVDDISSDPGECAPALLGCSFEDPASDGVCHWSRVNGPTNVVWSRASGPSSATNPGPVEPPSLNNTGNDYYLYMEIESSVGGGYKVELVSAPLYLRGSICLSFYYLMQGQHLGELEVVQLDKYGRESGQWTWTSASPTADWTPMKLTITAGPDPDSPVQLMFRAVRGSSVNSVIAIDAINGVSGTCDQYPDVLPTGPVIG